MEIRPVGAELFPCEQIDITKVNKRFSQFCKGVTFCCCCCCPTPPHVLMDFVVLPPGHDRSVTDFWDLDAHEAQLRCPDDVSGDRGGCSGRRALKPKFYQPTQTMVTAGILPFTKNSQVRAGNRTRDFMISSQRLWPLDHETGGKGVIFI